MAYVRTNWLSNETAVSAANMNNIEDGIVEAKADAAGATNTANSALALAQQISDQFLDRVYPVGAVYISTVSTSPSTLFGGTWEQIQGRFLVASGSNGESGDSELSLTAGATGGESKHTLTVNEMPAHRHTAREKNNSGAETAYSYVTENAKSAWGSTRISSTGGGQAHNILPPYLAVYMWKRTA